MKSEKASPRCHSVSEDNSGAIPCLQPSCLPPDSRVFIVIMPSLQPEVRVCDFATTVSLVLLSNDPRKR